MTTQEQGPFKELTPKERDNTQESQLATNGALARTALDAIIGGTNPIEAFDKYIISLQTVEGITDPATTAAKNLMKVCRSTKEQQDLRDITADTYPSLANVIKIYENANEGMQEEYRAEVSAQTDSFTTTD